MDVQRLAHSCLVIEESRARLVIDPGNFSPDLSSVRDVAAIVVTHEHPDHVTPENLATLLAVNPDAAVFAPPGVALSLPEFAITVVGAGDLHEAGPFRLEFFGERHAVIHESIPVIDNVGVLVNDALYYAGDAFTVPGRPISVLAAPAGAPWLKVSELMDYVIAVAPERVFLVHDAPLSEFGLGMSVARATWAVEQGGGTFIEPPFSA